MSGVPNLNTNASAMLGGTAVNRATNILGGQNGTDTDIARIIAAAQGPDANGGFSSILGSDQSGGLFRSNTLPIMLLGFGALILVGFILWKR